LTFSREIRLKSRPQGQPSLDNFEIVSVKLPPPGSGQIQVRNRLMSVDPYMRGRLFAKNAINPQSRPFEIGAALTGTAMGEVMASNNPAFKVGDLVKSQYGWREAYNVLANELTSVTPDGLPLEAYMAAAGPIGLTAYVGLMRAAAINPGNVVFVSAAAGAVGATACQIAKLQGCKVIASAGGPAKIRFLKEELGVDEAIDYKAIPDLTAALHHAAPDGIDVYFDNVGGNHLEAALEVLRPRGRIALCGLISGYADPDISSGPRNMIRMITKSLMMMGFEVFDHMDMAPAYHDALKGWHARGRFKWVHTFRDGLASAPEALFAVYRGENLGKMLVRL